MTPSLYRRGERPATTDQLAVARSPTTDRAPIERAALDGDDKPAANVSERSQPDRQTALPYS
jgi:hypothetical protein